MDSIHKKIVENIDSYDQLGKNHKKLRATDGNDGIYQISKGNHRVWYVVSIEGKREVIRCFLKDNHLTTDQAL